MKKIIKILIILAPLSAYAMDDDLNQAIHGKTFLSPRSQSVNAARELVLWHPYINLYDQNFYGAFSITPEYGHSFRPARLAEYFFGVDELVISGSQVANRNNETQLLADYFGLSPLFQSTVRMEPEIRTALIDLDFYLGWQDFYFRIHAPVVWTKWIFELHETIAPQVLPQGTYPPLYMDIGSVPAPADSFKQAIAGELTWGK